MQNAYVHERGRSLFIPRLKAVPPLPLYICTRLSPRLAAYFSLRTTFSLSLPALDFVTRSGTHRAQSSIVTAYNFVEQVRLLSSFRVSAGCTRGQRPDTEGGDVADDGGRGSLV